MPEAAPSLSPDRWPLSTGGREAARALRGRLPVDAVWLTSAEPKAVETARLAAGPFQDIAHDDRFGEVRRPGEPHDDDVLVRRRAWVEGALDARHAGWETLGSAGDRFQEALAQWAPRAGNRSLVVGTHGMVLTAWLVRVGVVSPGSAAGELWASLTFPDVVEVWPAGG